MAAASRSRLNTHDYLHSMKTQILSVTICLVGTLALAQQPLQPKSTITRDSLKTYQLNEIVIRDMSMEKFRRDFLGVILPAKPGIAIDYTPPRERSLSFNPAVGGPSWKSKKGPVSMLYDKFSRRAKTERKLAQRMAYNQTYSREWVAKITNLKDQQLTDFMIYCRPPTAMVLEGMEYDLVVYVRECLKNFLVEHKG